MKWKLALAAGLLAGWAPAASAQEFKLPPERGEDVELANYTCPELDQEIAKARKYIEMVTSEVSFIVEDTPSDEGRATAGDGQARGEAANRANDRLGRLESMRQTKNCPGPIPE